MRHSLAFLLSLLIALPHLAIASGIDQTHENIPGQNASFISDLQTFLKREDGDRFKDLWAAKGFVTSGCTHGTVASLTATPSACTAYPGGYYVTEFGSITYTASTTCYVIVNETMSGALATFVRQGATHYLTDCTSPSKPTLPANSAWLMQVTTNSSSVTAVQDLRTLVPDMPVYLASELPAAGNWGRMAFVRNTGTGTIYWDNGSAWVQVTQNPMTAAGDVIVGGTNGVPTRLAVGSANQVLGVNNGGTTEEWKSVVAGSGIQVANTPNTITVSQTVFPPTGSLAVYAGTTAPSGWLMTDGTAYTATTYSTTTNSGLFDILLPNIAVWGRGTAVGAFTVNVSTDIFSLNAHGKNNGDVVHVANSGGGLPAPLTTATKYYIIAATLNTFQLSTTLNGTAIDITTTGSGTNSLYDKFQVPDTRSRTVVGLGQGSGLTNRTIGATTGNETITVAALPTHGHTVTDPGHSHTHIGGLGGGAATANYTEGGSAYNTTQNDATSSNTTGITIGASSCGSCTTAADGNMQPAIVFNYIIKTRGTLWQRPQSMPMAL